MKNRPPIRSFVIAAALGVTGLLASSCGTVSGLGEDIDHLGRKIERKADGRGIAGGLGEDLSTLGRKMERKADDVRYGDRY